MCSCHGRACRPGSSPARGPAGGRRRAGIAAAVDDVGPEQVVDRCGEGVHEPREGPRREQQHRDQDVGVELDRRCRHGVDVRLQQPDGAEPRGHGLAVVVGLVPGADGDQGGPQAERDGAHEQDVHDLVVGGGGHEDRAGAATSDDQDEDAGQGAEAGDAAEEEGVEVVDALGHSDGLGPGLGDDETPDVPDEDDEDAEVEQRRPDPQQSRLVELGGAGGPAELVVAVAPEGAEHQRGDDEVGQHAPQQDVHQRPPICESGSSRGSSCPR